MADLSADYAGILDTTTKLSTQCGIIIPEIYSLMAEVSTLLDNGLYLEQASPALKTAYEEFSRSLQSAAGNLQIFANIFTGIKESLQNNDAELFASTLSSLDGEGGYEVTAEDFTTTPPDPPAWNDANNIGGTPVTWNEDRTQLTGHGS
ncbi:hypothetical protein E1265_13445 [Streptomyces sp. 8K308]|uniref:Uncharacterized protein n=1 Tax=Streptomyces millisiae TaxID=3075542 RepID=A0ABU2LSG4_9ACTN|nr:MULTISPECIES: hypothetical protein [unclassified Streptomyces]MDT0320537.1 hypothetical protein [Streptomyces sp. DSM 44918]TDC23219.1 hypothetical protein E1265_13445 [Streptomyces sp. 8K308]